MTDIDNMHLRSAKQNIDTVADCLFFILGAGRSGTTLLQSCIVAHPLVTIPPETKFYQVFADRSWLYGDPSQEAVFQKMIPVIWKEYRLRGMEVNEAVLQKYADVAERSWHGLFLALLSAWAEHRDTWHVGEKSPIHTHYMDQLTKAFPRAKFIHLIRDPRAIINSRLQARLDAGMLASNIDRLRRTFGVHQTYAARLDPTRYMHIRYEDLVSDMQSTLERVCLFLDIEFCEAMLEPHTRQERAIPRGGERYMQNTLRPVFASSLEKWRTDLSRRQVALIEHELSQVMESLNYERTGHTTRLPNAQLAFSRAGARVLTLVQWFFRVMKWLGRGGWARDRMRDG